MTTSNLDYRTIMQLLLWQAPSVVVWTIGLILAVVRWRRHPRVSAFFAIAMVVLIGVSIFGPVGWYLIAVNYRPGNVWTDWHSTALQLASTGLHVIGYALILVAVFSDRQPMWRFAPPPEYSPPGPNRGRRGGVDLPPDAIRE